MYDPLLKFEYFAFMRVTLIYCGHSTFNFGLEGFPRASSHEHEFRPNLNILSQSI